MSTNGAQIDLTKLLERCLGNPEMARHMLALFSEHVVTLVSKLEQAAVTQDWAEAKRCAHRLRGSAANLAADQLVQLATEAEDSANAEVGPALCFASKKINQAVNECIKGMDGLLAQLS